MQTSRIPRAKERKTASGALIELESQGKYCFSTDDFAAQTGREPHSVATKAALARLVVAGRIISIRKNPSAWLLSPILGVPGRAPDYKLWLHAFLTKEDPAYYLGFGWAAQYWGCTQINPRDFQVAVSRARFPIALDVFDLSFIVKKNLLRTPVIYEAASGGSVRVSTPEATLLDLIRHPESIGGAEALITAFCELAPQFTTEGLLEALEALDNVACAQRAGFLAEGLGFSSLADETAKWIGTRRSNLIQFNPKSKEPCEYSHKRFKVRYGELEREVVGC